MTSQNREKEVFAMEGSPSSAAGLAGQMMEQPLLLSSIVDRAGKMFADQEVVEYSPSGVTRVKVGEVVARARRLASALDALGIQPGDRIATLAWNSSRHIELFLGVPSMGAVLVPLNVRLHANDLEYIVRDSAPRALFVDASLVERLPEAAKAVDRIIIMDDGGARADAVANALDYESLILSGDPDHEFGTFPERSASTICYTSGTTSKPKGVVYSHRSTVLHTLLESLPDYYNISEHDVILPIAPLFHGNAWGLPYAALMAGARLVLPGSLRSPQEIVNMIAEQGVTFAGAIVSIWHDISKLPNLPELPSLRMAVAGGAAVSTAMIRRFDELGIPLVQGFGLTETNPLLSIGAVPARSSARGDDLLAIRSSLGRPLPLVQTAVDDEVGGELLLRGPTIASGYYNVADTERFTADGWMRTGDIVQISDDGVMKIVDRKKDLVKSGGEWIPSIELEGAIVAHPEVLEAAVVAVPDPRWSERPFAFVVPKDGCALEATALREYLLTKVARWWVPERIEIIAEIPRTPGGKSDKRSMRTRAEAIVTP
ncbi:long-chain-fatty-acid--CoA ligase [Rhodococcus sp. NPDC057014]|uniref:long-chain-fatty-acid--CoA ligase n=1 Tax=Rhodococcus sp. NPDC057014 TaxID=3346000 RepID=UPI0036330425